MEYKIIKKAGDMEHLILSVNEHIADGWRPQGGVVVVWYEPWEDFIYHQSMVRENALEEMSGEG